RADVEALVGRPELAAAVLEHALIDERLQAVGEDVGGDARAAADVGEAAPAEQHLAHHQQRPPLADDRQRAGDRAVLILERAERHLAEHGTKMWLQNATACAYSCRMQRRWQVLTVVSIAVFMASLDLFIVNIAFPDIRADFPGTSVATLSWVLNAYAIVFAALLVPAGRLADRFGRRRGFLTGLGLFLA